MIQKLSELYNRLNTFPEYIHEIIANTDKYYTSRSEPKTKYGVVQKDKQGNIRYRALLIPNIKLKRLQQRINCLLNEIESPEYAFGSIQEANHVLNASKHLNHSYILTIDLKNFFQNITHHQVFNTLIQNEFSPSVARIVTKLTTYKYSLPQGAPSSPCLANLAFQNTALQLQKLVIPHEIIFTTFLDDLSFSSEKCFKFLVPVILETIRRNKFFPAHNKIHYQREQSEITGLVVSRSRLKIKPAMLERAQVNPLVKAYVAYVNRYNSFYAENGFASTSLI